MHRAINMEGQAQAPLNKFCEVEYKREVTVVNRYLGYDWSKFRDPAMH